MFERTRYISGLTNRANPEDWAPQDTRLSHGSCKCAAPNSKLGNDSQQSSAAQLLGHQSAGLNRWKLPGAHTGEQVERKIATNLLAVPMGRNPQRTFLRTTETGLAPDSAFSAAACARLTP
jgi:hypothetical protein